MGEINSVRLKINIWKKYLKCQHYLHVCSFCTQKSKLTTLLNNYWPAVYFSKMKYDHRLSSTIVSLLILLTFREGYIYNGKKRDCNSKIIVQCRLKAFQESNQKPSKIFINDLDFFKFAS